MLSHQSLQSKTKKETLMKNKSTVDEIHRLHSPVFRQHHNTLEKCFLFQSSVNHFTSICFPISICLICHKVSFEVEFMKNHPFTFFLFLKVLRWVLIVFALEGQRDIILFAHLSSRTCESINYEFRRTGKTKGSWDQKVTVQIPTQTPWCVCTLIIYVLFVASYYNFILSIWSHF